MEETRTVSAQDVSDYAVFSRHHRVSPNVSELQMFERFFAARSLANQGMSTLLDAVLSDPQDGSAIRVDVCGIQGENMTVFFCEEGSLRSSLAKSIEKVRSSENAKAVILVPSKSDLITGEHFSRSFSEGGKVMVEALGWFDDEIDTVLQQTLRLTGMLVNETRMRMLAPLFRKTSAKKDYRAKINPKLVYENLSILTSAGLIEEMSEGSYELSELGKSILAEFITFLEKARKTLEAQNMRKGVKMFE